MTNIGFLIAAVVLGALVLAAVLWNFVRPGTQQNVILATTLSLIGFTLVSSPLWASIAIKGPQWEISLLRQQSEVQIQSYIELLDAYQKVLSPDKASIISPAVQSFKSSVKELGSEKLDKDRIKKIEDILKTVTSIAVGVAG